MGENNVGENGFGDYPKGNLLRKPQTLLYKSVSPVKTI
jgi:hypothetical protein